jgi:translocator protein
MQILSIVFGLVSLVCFVILVIAAFKSAVWKGILGFFCGLYLLYFGFTEFDHPKKMLITIGYLVGVIGFYATGGAAMMGGAGAVPAT